MPIIMPDGLVYDPAIHDPKPEPIAAPTPTEVVATEPAAPVIAVDDALPEEEQTKALTVIPAGAVSAPEPELMRLSPSIAKVLLSRSPLHAWDEHRLGGGAERESSDAQDVGKVCEKLLLGGGPEIVALDFDNYKTKEAQKQRAEAESEGKLPVLIRQVRHYSEMLEAWREQLAARGIEFRGKSQVTLKWVNPDSQTPCKGILDHLIVDEASGLIIDLKSCNDASDDATDRAIVKFGYDVQHAAYLEGANLTYPRLAGSFKFLFIFAETWRPWAINVRPFAGSMAELGDHKWQRACRIWGNCLERNYWPGYEHGNPVEAKNYQLEDDMQKQIAAIGNDNVTVPF